MSADFSCGCLWMVFLCWCFRGIPWLVEALIRALDRRQAAARARVLAADRIQRKGRGEP